MISLTTLMAKAEQHDSEIKELQEQVKEMTALVQQLAESDQRDREAAKVARQSEQQFWKDAEQDIETLLVQFEAKLAAAGR